MSPVSAPLPRVTIQYCIQCKWMLRAGYLAQELLSTFGTALGEVALQPSTGGTFIVSLYSDSVATFCDKDQVQTQHHILWDRKAEGGFPETKELKRRVRDIIEPGRDLGHVDGKKKSAGTTVADGKVEGKEGSRDDKITIGPVKPDQKEDPSNNGQMPHAREDIRSKSHDSETRAINTGEDLGGDRSEAKIERKQDEVKRNPDGSICEDCNSVTDIELLNGGVMKSSVGR